MTQVCQVTRRRPQTGRKISHANNKTKRRFFPNLHNRRLWVPSQNRFITLRVSARGLRTIDKLGIEAVLEKIKNDKDV